MGWNVEEKISNGCLPNPFIIRSDLGISIRRLFGLSLIGFTCLLSRLLSGAEGNKDEGSPRFGFQAVLSDLEPLRDREDRKPELLFAAVDGSFSRKGWGAVAEVRVREEKFRPYFGGVVWLERGWAYLDTPVGQVRVGKLRSLFGIEDETFGGNLFSLDGVGRNPDWGLSVRNLAVRGFNQFEWGIRYVGQNDHVAWEEDGRGVESDPDGKLRDGFEGRGTYLFNQGLTSERIGLSAATARIVDGTGREKLRRTDVAADVRGSFGPLAATVSLFRREGSAAAALESGTPGSPRYGYDDAWAGLFVFSAEFPNVVWRYTYSEWRYRGLLANERIHQPSVTWTPRKGIAGTIEYSSRRLRTEGGARASNALRFGLALTF